MLPTQRRQAILAEVRQAKAVSAEDLARRYGVSLETIRRDLRGLRDQGLLERVYGGALSVRSTEGDFATRSTLHAARKQAIAQLAATLVEPEDTLVIDIGTTALEVARALPESFRGRVLTNSVPAAMALADRAEIELLLCGGQVRHGDAACFGAQAEAFFADFYADKAFLGSGGVHAQAGLTDYHPPDPPPLPPPSGPFMLATLLGAYTIVGFEAASNLAEETHEPHRVIPKAMLRAVLVSGVVGFAFLISLAYATNKAAYASTAPVASIVHDVLGGAVQKIFLVFVCVSIFACGLIIMVTNGRLIFSMARDRRLPGHQLLHQVPTGHRRAALGHRPGRGPRRGHHAGAAHPHRRAGHAVHRVHDHAGAAVRGHGAAVHIHVPAAGRAGKARARATARSGNMNFRSWPAR